MPARLDDAGQLATFMPSAADRFGGHFIDDEHAMRLGAHTVPASHRQPAGNVPGFFLAA